MHFVFFAFEAQAAFVAGLRHAAQLQQLIAGHDLGADEAAGDGTYYR